MSKTSLSRPRFSIVIPAYNEELFIAATIASLKQQTFNGEYEIIVVDNNCTDQTATIAHSLGAKIVTQKNPGVCWARQAGTLAARGEIIVSTDADTTYPSGWLSRIDQQFKLHPEAIAVGGPCHFVNGPLWGRIYPNLMFGLFHMVYLFTGRAVYASATNIAFRREAWDGYDTNLTQGGDELDLLRRLRKKGKVIFDNWNPSHSSARRLVRGFIYNFFVSWLIFYIIEYNLSRIFKRPVLGSMPKFRNERSPELLSFLHVFFTLLIIGLFCVYTKPGHRLVYSTYHFIKNTSHHLIGRI